VLLHFRTGTSNCNVKLKAAKTYVLQTRSVNTARVRQTGFMSLTDCHETGHGRFSLTPIN